MTDIVVIVAFALLVLGVIGSVVPVLPGAPLSLFGVYLYWWTTGYAEPGLPLLVALTVVGALAIAVDLLAGVVSARASGVSTRLAVLAGVVGGLAFLVAGPIGLVLGVAGTVFIVTLAREGTVRAGGRAAGLTTLGILSSSLVEGLLTGSMLVAMVAIVVL